MAENAEKTEANDGEKVKEVEKDMKSTVSLRKKAASKLHQSRVSLKKLSSISQTSYGSDGSVVVKRQSDFERIATKQVPRYQNSYRLDPLRPFNESKVHGEIVKSVHSFGIGHVYEDNLMTKIANKIAQDLRSKLKQLNYDRCKLCVLVIIAENKLQGVDASFRALWDASRDSWSSYTYKCKNYIICVACFGLYHD